MRTRWPKVREWDLSLVTEMTAKLVQIRHSGFPFLKHIPEETPWHEEKPHPMLPPQLLSPLNKPMRQHPKWPDAPYRVHRDGQPELHRTSVGQVEKERQMSDIDSSDYHHPERIAVGTSIRFDSHVV